MHRESLISVGKRCEARESNGTRRTTTIRKVQRGKETRRSVEVCGEAQRRVELSEQAPRSIERHW
eukprot:15436840-Alexandrium_andersonii.AAC.1